MTDKKEIIGIDLGTTFSAIARITEGGKSEIVPNQEGDNITPSVVEFVDKETIVVGRSAKDSIGVNDDNIRKETITFVKNTCVVSAKLGCHSTYLRPGSINPNGPWQPHPENHSDEVFERLINSTKDIASVAESEGMMLLLEGAYVSPIFSAKRAKEFIDAVGSKNLKFNQDPVNFISNLEQAYNTKDFLEEFFTLLGEHTISADLKDFTVVDSLLLKFEEEYLGSGMMDQVYFLKRMQEICPDAHILIEHIPREKFEPSYAETLKFSEKAGITWDKY